MFVYQLQIVQNIIIMIANLIKRNIYWVRQGKKFGGTLNKASADSSQSSTSSKHQTSLNQTKDDLPFKINGLNQIPKHDPIIQNMVSLKPQFIKDLYKDFLNSVEKKNKSKLMKILDPELVSPIMNAESLQFVNKQADLQIYFEKLQTGLGDIKRLPYNCKTSVQSSGNFIYYIVMDFNNPQKFMEFRSTGIPVIHSLHLYIKSRCSLAYPGQKIQKQNIHKIVLEQQNKKKIQDLASIILKVNSMKAIQMRDFIFKSQSLSWRIGNIDHYLKERVEKQN